MKNTKVWIAVIAILFTSDTISAGSYSYMNCSSVWSDDKQQSNIHGAIRLTLLHYQHPCSPVRHINADLPPSRSMARDRERQVAASLFFGGRRRTPPTKISAPVNSAGALYGFVAQISLGTPPTKHSVLIDTASSFSWVQCKPCVMGCYEQDDPLFDSGASSTYRALSCLSASCLSAVGATRSRTECTLDGGDICLYRTEYYDSSASIGYLSSDTLTVGDKTLQGFVFGCSQGYQAHFGRYSGIVGFGDHELSFFSQIAQGEYKAFSYYLPSPSSVGYIQVGSYDEGALAFTPMFTAGHIHYLVLTGITVAGRSVGLTDDKQKQFLGQPEPTTWCYLDLGTPFTVLPRHVFDKLNDAVGEEIKGYKRVDSAPWCFDPFYPVARREVPTVVMQFRDGARLVLDERRLMSQHDDGRRCLGFERGSHDIYILGSMQIMMLYVVQDLEKSRMGF